MWTSPTIVISPSGSIVITLPLVACFSIALKDDLSVDSSLTSLYFQTLKKDTEMKSLPATFLLIYIVNKKMVTTIFFILLYI